MIYIASTKEMGTDSNGKTLTLFTFICDTALDLPAKNKYETEANTLIFQNSIAIVIDPKSSYKMKTDGTWVIQDVGNDYYSKAEIDDLLDEKQDLLVLDVNFDRNPVSGSNNPVRSGGVVNYTYGAASDIIPSGANLNSYTTPGAYRCETNTIAQSLTNCPTSNGFRMEVMSTIASEATGYQIQTIYPNNANGEFFMRRRGSASSGTWSSWFKFQGTAV